MLDLPHNETDSKRCVRAAASIIASKWTPQLILAMHEGIARFCELQKAVGGVNPRTLSARLDDLEKAEIIRKESYAELPPRIEYRLTKKGEDLLPIIDCMVEWGTKYPPPAACEKAIEQHDAFDRSVQKTV